jgi:hypothetical protein
MLSFFYEIRQPSLVSARTGLLVACLFSALVNIQGVGYGAHGDPDPGRSNSPAVYIFAGALATVFSRLTAEAGQAKQAMWLDPRLLFGGLTISFIGLNAIVTSYVAIVGG